MTVSSSTAKVSYSANGTAHSFAYTFKIFADADLTVVVRSATGAETTQTLNTNYIVTNAGNSSGGNVLFKYNTGTSSDAHYSSSNHRPANGTTVVIKRVLTKTQTTDYVENDSFPAESHESALDRLTFITQGMQEELDRALKLSVTNTMTSTEFTNSATDRASKILAFDSSGEISVTQELGTYKGTSATTTTAAFVQRDIVKGSTTAQLNNVYICVADAAVGDSLTDTDHFALLVDAVSAATSATAAASSATTSTAQATIATNKAADAGKYAVTAEDSQFTLSDGSTTGYSALHYSAKATASASAAASSASAAASSATAAATALDNFDDIFLGAKSSDPSVDNDGDALTAGDLVFNTTSNVLKVYNGSSWQTIESYTTGISNGNIPVFTSGVVNNDFLKVSTTSIEGRSASEVLSDIGGQAALTFGISNTNAVKIDSASAASGEYARLTSSGIESRSTSEVLSDIGATTATAAAEEAVALAIALA